MNAVTTDCVACGDTVSLTTTHRIAVTCGPCAGQGLPRVDRLDVGELVTDLPPAAYEEDPAYDPSADITWHIKRTLAELVDALAYMESNPNRAEYIRTLADLHRTEPEPFTASIITAASRLQDGAIS